MNGDLLCLVDYEGKAWEPNGLLRSKFPLDWIVQVNGKARQVDGDNPRLEFKVRIRSTRFLI